jgi:hypothetical protein
MGFEKKKSLCKQASIVRVKQNGTDAMSPAMMSTLIGGLIGDVRLQHHQLQLYLQLRDFGVTS